jgi:sulfur carrier protein ThiS
MNIIIEFTGIARSITGAHLLPLKVADSATADDVIHALGLMFPGLINLIISADGCSLLNSNVFFLNGVEMISSDDHELILNDGDRLTLLSVIVGGSDKP